MTGWKLSAKIVVPVFIRSIQHNSGRLFGSLIAVKWLRSRLTRRT
jgi:hypothetical protein